MAAYTNRFTVTRNKDADEVYLHFMQEYPVPSEQMEPGVMTETNSSKCEMVAAVVLNETGANNLLKALSRLMEVKDTASEQ